MTIYIKMAIMRILLCFPIYIHTYNEKMIRYTTQMYEMIRELKNAHHG